MSPPEFITLIGGWPQVCGRRRTEVLETRMKLRHGDAGNGPGRISALLYAFLILGSIASFGASLVLAASSPPVALIENVKGSPAGIQVMDYVESGQVIRLGSDDSIVLSYLKSCWRETITGGAVTVGTEKSEVMNGKVERSRVACQGSKMQPAPALANHSGGMIFRGEPRLRPQVTLYGLSPVIEVDSGSSLVIERIDRPGERREISFSREQLMHNKFLDLAKNGVVLNAGGIYRAVAGNEEVVFNIDPEAQNAPAPIVSRLLRFQPVN